MDLQRLWKLITDTKNDNVHLFRTEAKFIILLTFEDMEFGGVLTGFNFFYLKHPFIFYRDQSLQGQHLTHH